MQIDIQPIGYIRKNQQTSICEIDEDFSEALKGIEPGVNLDVLYWMHELDEESREILQVHPRGDRKRRLKGVFAVRSPMRPNPIGVSTVTVTKRNQCRIFINTIDAFDGAPIIDIKASRS